MVHAGFVYSAAALPTVLICFGLRGIFFPDAHLKALEFPVQPASQPELRKWSHALMRIWGIRNLSFGTLLLIIWVGGDMRLMAQSLLVSILLPVMDGWVSRRLIGGGELQHWVFPPILGFVAAGLFGFFD